MRRIKRIICTVMAAVMLVSAPVCSYREAKAAEILLTLGGIAIGDIITSLVVTAGVTALGVTAVNQMKANSKQRKSLEDAIKSDPVVSAAIDEAESYKKANSNVEIKDIDYSSKWFKLGPSKNPNSLDISISAETINAVKRVAKKWADSDDNQYEAVAGADLAGKLSVDSQYVNSITTSVYPFPTIGSIDDIDSYFGISGAGEYLKSQGYSDSDYYFLICLNGNYTYITPVPIGYSVVSYKCFNTQRSIILSDGDYKGALSRFSLTDYSSFTAYMSDLSNYVGNYYCYNSSTRIWDEISAIYLPVYNSLIAGEIANWYACNYKAAYDKGSMITANYFDRDMKKVLYSYKTLGKNILYDLSKAVSIPDEGYTFVISEKDFTGFNEMDLSAMLDYISSLSDELSKWREEAGKNDEEMIEQQKDIISGISSIYGVIKTISTSLKKVLDSVVSLPVDMAKAIWALFSPMSAAVLGIPQVLDSILEAVLSIPDVLNDILASVKDLALNGIAIALEIPEIVWPDFEWPALPKIELPALPAFEWPALPKIELPALPAFEWPALPKIELPALPAFEWPALPVFEWPAFEWPALEMPAIGDMVSDAVESVLTDLFVPDEDLTLEKVGKMQEYFKFEDDIIREINLLVGYLKAIKPSPYLKLPIGKSKSKKYNYGTGDYFVVDISWYKDYKAYGDSIILALAWALFLWRVFIKLPGIISGTEGSIMAAEKSYNRYIADISNKAGGKSR